MLLKRSHLPVRRHSPINGFFFHAEESTGIAGVTCLSWRFSLMFVRRHLSNNKQFAFSGDDLDLSTAVEVGLSTFK